MSSRSFTDPLTNASGRAQQARSTDVLRGLWRRRLLILVPVLAAAGLTSIWLATVNPLYRSTARVSIPGVETNLLRAEHTAEQRGLLNGAAMGSQIQLILSRDLGRQVIRQLDLASRPEFIPDAASGAFSAGTILAALGAQRDPARLSGEEQILEAYYDRLAVTPAERAHIISIDFVSEDSLLAARAANAVAESYIEMQRTAGGGVGQASSHGLSEEIDALRSRLDEAETRVTEFRQNATRLAGEEGAGASISLVGQELSELTSQLALVRSEKSAAQARARLIRRLLDSGAPLEASEILNSPSIQRLSEQQVRARAQLAELSSTLGPRHPRIRSLDAELGDLRRQAREEAEKLARALETDAELAAQSERELLQALEALKVQAGQAGSRDEELRELESEAQANRESLQSLLLRRETAAVGDPIPAALNPRIVSRASPASSPFYPRSGAIMLVVILGAAVMGVGMALLAERRRSNDEPDIRLPESVSPPASTLAARVDVHATATPPMQKAASPAGVNGGAKPTAGNGGLASIADAIARPPQNDGSGRVVLTTSLRRLPETTDIGLRLARMVAERGARVALVDMRFGETLPPLQDVLPSGSLAGLLAGRCAFEAALVRDPASRVHVIAAGDSTGTDDALISSDRMEMVLKALSQTYNTVVLLAPPLSRRPDLQVVGRWADLAVMTIRGHGSDAAAGRARDRLANVGIKDVALITVADAPLQAPASMLQAA